MRTSDATSSQSLAMRSRQQASESMWGNWTRVSRLSWPSQGKKDVPEKDVKQLPLGKRDVPEKDVKQLPLGKRDGPAMATRDAEKREETKDDPPTKRKTDENQ